MVNTLARLVSYIFHPLLMATYLFSLLAWLLPSALEPIAVTNHRSFIFIIFIVTFLLPVLNLGIFKLFGTIKTFHMVEQKERLIPFVFIALIYVIITYMLLQQTRLSVNDNFLRFMIIIDSLVLVTSIVTFFL